MDCTELIINHAERGIVGVLEDPLLNDMEEPSSDSHRFFVCRHGFGDVIHHLFGKYRSFSDDAICIGVAKLDNNVLSRSTLFLHLAAHHGDDRAPTGWRRNAAQCLQKRCHQRVKPGHITQVDPKP